MRQATDPRATREWNLTWKQRREMTSKMDEFLQARGQSKKNWLRGRTKPR